MRTAVIGIGSNSLRLLVAETNHGVQIAVLRERIGLRVFAALNENSEISDNMIHDACEAVALLQQKAVSHGADQLWLFATSAVRDAANQSALVAALKQKTSLTLDICSGELEAKLSFLGAAGEGNTGMIDIGGGSTEIVIGNGVNLGFTCSLQAGAVRLYRETTICRVSDITIISRIVQGLLLPYMDAIKQQKTPAIWVGVGGTFTAAAACIQNVPWDSKENIHGFVATQAEIRRITERFACMTENQRRSIPCIPPDRADIIVHGFAIMLSCMEALQINAIKISKHTNLDGYLRMVTAGE